jgi:putative ABC transport system permease protein
MSSVFLAVAREGALHVLRRPLRSALEAVSCAVAIAVAVNVIAVSRGLDADVRRDLSRFGRLSIDVRRASVVRTGGTRAPFGPEEQARVGRVLDGLAARLVPLRQETVAARGDAEVPRLSVAGVGADYGATLDLPLVAGRWFGPGDATGSACVLDESVARAAFPGRAPAEVLGRRLSMEGTVSIAPAVVGVLADPMTHRALFDAFDEGRGSRTLASALFSFRNAYLPIDALPGDDLTRVVAVLPDEARHAEAARRLRTQWPEDEGRRIEVFVRKEWMDALGTTSRTGALLGNLVWVLVVGVAAVMISTLNLAGVRERYDEIAVRRCEGARRRHVAAQLGVEGVVVALAGGMIGLPLGHAASRVLSAAVGLPFTFRWEHAVAGTAIAAALGLVASVLPARRAAGLQPARVLSRRVL